MNICDLSGIDTVMQSVAKSMEGAIRTKIEECIEVEADMAKDRIVGRIRGAVGEISAKVLQNFTFERFGQELVIRVKFYFPESKPTTLASTTDPIYDGPKYDIKK